MPVYWIWFAQLKGIGARKKCLLLEQFQNPEEIYLADEKCLPADVREALADKDLTKARSVCAQCARHGIGILTYGDEDYPERLRNIEDPPLVLYYKGKLPQWQSQPVIGVVGTRKASTYGLQTARLLGAQIAACGGLVVSGAATGIDAASMQGALEAGKTTIGVLGGGVDVVYPVSNRDLYRATQAQGCLLSEYLPGSRPYPGNFLQRNRIISGISDGVLVVEAPEKSGAMNTARHAFSQGRDLFVAPGNLGVDSCAGSNSLLQEGAYAALSGWDVVKHYAPLYPAAVANNPVQPVKPAKAEPAQLMEQRLVPQAQLPKSETAAKIAIDNWDKSTYSVINKQPVNLSDQENAVLALLSDVPQLADSVMDACDLPSGTVQSILTRLAIKGLVICHPDGRVCKK